MSFENGRFLYQCTRCDDRYYTIVLGDADGDGKVTINDVTAIQRCLAMYTVKGFNENGADIEGDGLDILDATRIQHYLAAYHNPWSIGDEKRISIL